MLRQVQLRWSSHLLRMDDERLPKRLLYGDVATDARRPEGQKRRYNDTWKKSLKQLQINLVSWEDLAHDRPAWRRFLKTGQQSVRPTCSPLQGQKGGSQVTSSADQHRQYPNPANVPRLSMHIPRANWPGQTSSKSMQQQSHNINFRHTCLRPLDDDLSNH
ncbi:unnamed protein product [Schistocephalus solidus]|uniref:Uncharacterized protein n=1 Tax=Schistocephalus solidus TaxID=70667 RepID=A0A183TPI7_SCHSO|nr:unnamed protein product [Schistocephalus solidus]